MQLFGGGDEFAKKKDIVNPNLLTGTADFSGCNWIYQGASCDPNTKAPNGNICVKETQWNQAYQVVNLVAGKFYTFSLDVKGTYAQLMVQTPDGKDPTNIKGENTQKIHFQNDTWNRASMTIYCLESGKVRFFEAQAVEHYVANMKLEIGTVATPWCPAPEDFAMKYDTFSGGVNLFRDTDKLDKFWIPCTDSHGSAESYANYASDVNHELIATKSVFHVWGSKANEAGLKSTQQIYFEQGTYTISFLARNNGTDAPSFNLSLYSDYTDSRGGTPVGSTSANLTNIWQKYSITFRIDQAGTYGGWRLINLSDVNVPGGSIYFANLKLERGSTATDWCPNYADYYDDLQSKISGISGLLPSNIKTLGNTDLNNLPSGWCLVMDSTSPNFPPNGSGKWCICFTLYASDTDRFQIAITYNEGGCDIYVRTCGGSPARWVPWKKISYSA